MARRVELAGFPDVGDVFEGRDGATAQDGIDDNAGEETVVPFVDDDGGGIGDSNGRNNGGDGRGGGGADDEAREEWVVDGG